MTRVSLISNPKRLFSPENFLKILKIWRFLKLLSLKNKYARLYIQWGLIRDENLLFSVKWGANELTLEWFSSDNLQNLIPKSVIFTDSSVKSVVWQPISEFGMKTYDSWFDRKYFRLSYILMDQVCFTFSNELWGISWNLENGIMFFQIKYFAGF